MTDPQQPGASWRRPDRGDVLDELDRSLHDDVGVLGALLGHVLVEAGGQVLLDDVERLRALVITAYEHDDPAALDTAAALDRLRDEVGEAEARARLQRLRFHPVLTAPRSDAR